MPTWRRWWSILNRCVRGASSTFETSHNLPRIFGKRNFLDMLHQCNEELALVYTLRPVVYTKDRFIHVQMICILAGSMLARSKLKRQSADDKLNGRHLPIQLQSPTQKSQKSTTSHQTPALLCAHLPPPIIPKEVTDCLARS